jgi:hypothetical protein
MYKRNKPKIRGQRDGNLRNHELKELLIREGWIKNVAESSGNATSEHAESDHGSEPITR